MMRTMLAATAVAVLGTAAPAAAATTGPGVAPRAAAARTDLVLTTGPGVAPRPPARTGLVVTYLADAGYAAAVTLSCDPAGGAHPKAAEACAVLATVSGRPGRLEPAATMCTMEYAPITAQINGVWRGRKIKWSHTYPNHCDMTRSTGALTAF
jgi:hypothetical protein